MSEEEIKAEASADEAAAAPEAAPAPKKRKKKLPIILGVVVVVLVAAGDGFWVWHEQPSFCGAICHTPMDEYLETYEQEADTTGVDKYGNEVTNTSAMLCVSHKVSEEEGGAGATCLSCHIPVLSEQISEGINWISGNYTYPLYERTTSDLTEASGTSADEFCLNESCHNITRDDLIEATSYMTRNVHVAQHGTNECTTCHKGHRASVNYCSSCHSDAEIPDGWLTVAEANVLDGVS